MSRAERIFAALSAACASAVVAYVSVRIAEFLFFPRGNPAVIVWSEQSGFVWRIAAALYIAGASFFGAHALLLRSPELASRLLSRLVTAALVCAVLQSIALP